MTLVKPRSYSVKEAAEIIGASVAIVRLRCADGSCPAEYHEFPGTKRGFYLLTDRSLKWLRENVTPRNRDTNSAE